MRTELFDLYIKVLDDQTLNFKQKRQMLNEVRKVMSPEQNRWNFRYVILPLALVALSVLIYAVVLLGFRGAGPSFPEIPAPLLSVGSTAVGALAGFLTHHTQPRSGSSSAPVTPTASPPQSVPPAAPAQDRVG
jgi:hypothetical protein